MTKRVPREQKDPYVFDEAQSAILRELLPYWAGYCKQYKDMETPPEFPCELKEYSKLFLFIAVSSRLTCSLK